MSKVRRGERGGRQIEPTRVHTRKIAPTRPHTIVRARTHTHIQRTHVDARAHKRARARAHAPFITKASQQPLSVFPVWPALADKLIIPASDMGWVR